MAAAFQVPLASIETEQALLGAILVNNDAVHKLKTLQPEDFCEGVHSEIFRLLTAMIAEGVTATPYSAGPRMVTVANIGDQTVAQYLGRLAANATSTVSAPDYAQTIRELSQRRALVQIGRDLAAMGTTGQSVPDAAALAVSALDTVLAASRQKRVTRQTFSQAASDFLDDVLNGTGQNAVTTGLASLDKPLGGWPRPGYSILAGRPSMGKTAVATSAMLRTAKAGIGVLYFSLEMSRNQLLARCLSDLAWSPDQRIAYSDAINGRLSERQTSTLGRTAAHFATLPLVIDDQSGLTMAEIAARSRAEAQRMERDGIKLGLVVIDYLSLIKPSGRYSGNKVNETGEISNSIAAFAKDQNVAVLALQQLNRNTEGREDKRPGLADLRNSGDLEQDADVVCFAYRESYYLERTKYDAGSAKERERLDELAACQNTLEIQIAKTRNGPTMVVQLYCDMACNAIRDGAS
jgi:replicative DNA helicase